MASKLEKHLGFFPPELLPRTNPVLNAILRAFAQEDEELATQIANAKAQLFVRTAEGVYLTRLAANFGVSFPSELGLLDEDFQELIPNLSLKAKQITKSFYETMDVFWGPTFSRANITSTATAPFNISVGDTFKLKVDGGSIQVRTVKSGDVAIDGAATISETLRFFNNFEGLTVISQENPTTGDQQVNFRTNTPGPRGSLEFISGFAGIFGFTENREVLISDLQQRTTLYQINPGEVLIELPAVVPSLRRTLKGSHHFHSDSTLESAIAPATTPWQGSFLYSTISNPFVVTQTKATLQTAIIKGEVVSQITVDDSSGFPASGGKLIFDFGKATEEQPVDFITVPNSNTILVDPGYVFENTHAIGSEVNLLVENQTTPYDPRDDGSDFAIYLTSPANARSLVQEILKSLTAAGITVSFLILLPEYRYLITNPFE